MGVFVIPKRKTIKDGNISNEKIEVYNPSKVMMPICGIRLNDEIIADKESSINKNL